MIFSPKVRLAWARTQCIFCLVQGRPVHCAETARREAGLWAGEARTWGRPPIPSGVVEGVVLATRAHLDDLACVLRAPAWPRSAALFGRREGWRTASQEEVRRAGLSPASPWRVGTGLGHRGRDKPGVLTPSPGFCP